MTQTARMYGGSLYDLAAEEQLEDVMLEQIQQIRQIFRDNPDYLTLLCELSLSKEERTGLIETAFGEQVHRYLVNFLKLLCERNILNEYAGCCEEFTRRYNAEHGIAEAVVTSAVPLTEEQLKNLCTRLEKVSGKKVNLTGKVNPSLIAGLCVELDGQRLDGSVSARLTGISRKLSEVNV
ncbi:MAG: ATP synthase F1 subunit delta [Lachnospiraceae bacterium]|nr:ATP synthase F1 subunit delta [Lachnospiraceae bacterium]